MQRKNIEAASSYIATSVSDDRALLNADAIDTSWTVTDLESRPDGDCFLVDVTIASGERTTAGAFNVEPDANGDLKITNPYVRLWLPYSSLGTFEVNELRVERESDGTVGYSSEIFAAYPGSYTRFPRTPGLHPSTLETLLLLPDGDNAARVRTVMETRFELPDLLAEEVNRLLVEQLDGCAASTEIRPPGCAFNAAALDEAADEIKLEIGWGIYEYEGEPAWTIMAYPDVEWWYVSGSIHAVETSPGAVDSR